MHPFMRQISITHRCAKLYRGEKLADTGLAGVHTPYLMALYKSPGISQEALARHLYVNKSSVTRHLNNLEASGFVRREPSPEDRRVLLVYPTDKALALRERIRETIHDWNAYLTEDLSDTERAQLSALMGKIALRAEAYVKGGEAPCGSSDNT